MFNIAKTLLKPLGVGLYRSAKTIIIRWR